MNQPSTHDQVAAMLRAGATYTQITTDLGVSTSTVTRVRGTLGIPVPPGRSGAPRKTAEQRRTAAEQRQPRAVAMLRAEHPFTHREIADACGISTATVHYTATAIGLRVPPGPGRDAARAAVDDLIAELLAARRTYAQIRAQLRVSGRRIAHVLHQRPHLTAGRRTRHQDQP